ncbi:hypothetical protein [Streptomyces sp. NPDC004065]|uniref:hypothetical protein n=1 Tax=Streptomyces sp. NPDC004065 TaxID=3364689 RepID=UPI00384BB671
MKTPRMQRPHSSLAYSAAAAVIGLAATLASASSAVAAPPPDGPVTQKQTCELTRVHRGGIADALWVVAPVSDAFADRQVRCTLDPQERRDGAGGDERVSAVSGVTTTEPSVSSEPDRPVPFGRG